MTPASAQASALLKNSTALSVQGSRPSGSRRLHGFLLASGLALVAAVGSMGNASAHGTGTEFQVQPGPQVTLSAETLRTQEASSFSADELQAQNGDSARTLIRVAQSLDKGMLNVLQYAQESAIDRPAAAPEMEAAKNLVESKAYLEQVLNEMTTVPNLAGQQIPLNPSMKKVLDEALIQINTLVDLSVDADHSLAAAKVAPASERATREQEAQEYSTLLKSAVNAFQVNLVSDIDNAFSKMTREAASQPAAEPAANAEPTQSVADFLTSRASEPRSLGSVMAQRRAKVDAAVLAPEPAPSTRTSYSR